VSVAAIITGMNALAATPLDNNWVYFFAENRREDYSQIDLDVSGWVPLEQLSDWAVTSSGQSGADWFRRDVTLEATGSCANYLLHIDRVPQDIHVYVNGTHVGEAEGGQPFHCDVTEYVAMGRNVVAMQLVCVFDACGGGFGKIYLQPVPCD
jgi:hypothetical protein